MKVPNTFLTWIFGHFNIQLVFVPFAARNVMYQKQAQSGVQRTGYRDYYLFGVRVARLQQTAPWVG